MVNYRKIVFTAAIVICCLGLLYAFSELFLVLAISLLISLVLDPIVSFIEKQRVQRLTAVILVLTTLTSLIYIGFSLLIPALMSQSSSLITALRDFSLTQELSKIEIALHQIFPFLERDFIARRLEKIVTGSIEMTLNQFTGFIKNIFSIFTIAVILPFTTFFFLKDKEEIIKSFLDMLPNKYFEMSFYISRKVSRQLSRYVRGWILDALFVGISCGLGFYLLGINSYLTLGIIAGLGHLVPYFGPIIGGIPALLISLLQHGDFSHAPQIFLLLGLIYVIDNGIVQPYVFSKSVNMHPVVIIMLIVAGSQIGGVFGMLLAVPTATVVKTAIAETYKGYKNYRITRFPVT